MVYLDDASTYLEQSLLLIQARPTTTRITTRYRLNPPQKSKASSTSTSTGGAAAPATARGALELKTYDPVSGACLKYRTAKQAEIGRLVGAMGRCARAMANVPVEQEEEELAAPATTTTTTTGAEQGQGQQQSSAPGVGAGGGGGGKKKKKGKK